MDLHPATIENLRSCLTFYGVDISAWKDGALGRLFQELKQGKCTISLSMSGKFRHVIMYMLIHIYKSNGTSLTEVNKTTYTTSTVHNQQRNCCVSGVLLDKEDVNECIDRLLKTRLGIDRGKFTLNYLPRCVVTKESSDEYEGLYKETNTLIINIPAEDLQEIKDGHCWTSYRSTTIWMWK